MNAKCDKKFDLILVVQSTNSILFENILSSEVKSFFENALKYFFIRVSIL